MFSPDGRWIAYRSNESGTSEIYVRPFPGGRGGKWQISTGGGLYGLWSNNGRELFYETVGPPHHGGGLHGEWRFVRARQAAPLVREADLF